MDKVEIIKSIEEIEQKLTRLQLTMKLLVTHTNVIEVFTLDELNSLNISSTERKKYNVHSSVKSDYLDKVKDGENLLILTNAIATNTSEELSSICYKELDELKRLVKEVV